MYWNVCAVVYAYKGADKGHYKVAKAGMGDASQAIMGYDFCPKGAVDGS